MHRGVGGVAALPGGGGGGGGKIAGLYDLEETLGSGHFAVVKLARHVFTGEKVAVKVIDKTKLDEVSRAHLFQEVRCMKLVQHPNVVRLYEVIDTQTKLYLILELGDGGDLYDYIMRHESGLSESLAREYFIQIVRAISYCHRLHVVHRDLKPENVVFFEKLGIVKLTDFGFSNKFCPGQKLETSCGSLAYSAPEILLGDSYDAPAVDVWSLGVILYMLVCGHAPFHEANDSETLTMIMDCKYTIPQHVSSECKALIGRMLVRQPEKRATLSQISADPWVRAVGAGDHSSGDPKGLLDDSLPLVSRQQLSEEDHAFIVQKMVNGQIASKEQILEALDSDEYNHVTATYYLLAERKLRAHRLEQSTLCRPGALSVGSASPAGGVKNNTKSGKADGRAGGASGPKLLAPPAQGLLLSVPRTPTDMPQRARKCSIVREEEDDEEGGGAGGPGRRGSRSEGRLHLLALQERPTDTCDTGKLASAITKVNLDDENTRMRLGNAGMGATAGWMSSFGKKNNSYGGDQCRPKSAVESGISLHNNLTPSSYSIPRIVKTPANLPRADTLKSPLPLLCEDDTPMTTSIKEASTISIPIRSSVQIPENVPQIYKTMPSAIRPLKHSIDDSLIATKHAKEVEDIAKANLYQQRRTKYHKSHRTASCSSSDASDEDSEGRKKRPPKHLNTPTHKPISQRRDSHDDSSDSQEHGATGGHGGGSSSGQVAGHTGGGSTGGGSGGGGRRDTGGGGTGGGGTGGGSSLSRRHRGGRRAGETRLRESQSLNRITEVQEADSLPAAHQPPQRPKGFFHPARFFGRRPVQLPPDVRKEPEKSPTPEKVSALHFLCSPLRPQVRTEEKENCHKLVTVSEKHSFKKVRLLSRYFQVHKKLCLPRLPGLPGLLGRGGRLYKAQSCGSIVRDKITSAGASSLLLVNELCRDKPLVMDSHRARIKLIADMAPRNGRTGDNGVHLNSPGPQFSICQIHLGDASKCCGLC